MVHIQFGIEIEFVLTPRGDEITRIEDFAEKLKKDYETYVASERLAWPGMENAFLDLNAAEVEEEVEVEEVEEAAEHVAAGADEETDVVVIAKKRAEAARKETIKARKLAEKAQKKAEKARRDLRKAVKRILEAAEEKVKKAQNKGSREKAAAKKDYDDAMWLNIPDSAKKGYDLDKWTLTGDSSITAGQGKFGIELVSPILRFNESRFRDLVRGVFSRIDESCIIETNVTCGTHVHISKNDGFSVQDAMAIARAILYFEPAINALVPADRRRAPGSGSTNYCKTFFGHHPVFKTLTPQAAIAMVDGINQKEKFPNTVTWDKLTDPFTDAFSHPITRLMNPDDRGYTWNFTSLPRTNTIEFRQPPGVTTAADTLKWAEFAITFVNAALVSARPDTNFDDFDDDVGGLKNFLATGNVPGISDEGILNQVTDGISNNARVPSVQAQD